MILRPPTMADHRFILETFKACVVSDRGPATEDSVIRNIRRWLHRTDEECLIGVDNVPVGLVLFRRNMFVAQLDYVVTHPLHQQKGHANKMLQHLKDTLISQGVVVAEFDALPGPMAEKVMRGDYEKLSEGTGVHTGLPTIKGREIVRSD